jgi:putative FmdB family regulatory protein
MPLYEYKCDACGKRFEKIRKFSDPPLDVCPLCGSGPVEKLISSPAFQFKGSGFYETDYVKKDKGSSSDSDKGSSAASSEGDAGKVAKKDGKESSDSKPAAASSESSKTSGSASSSTPAKDSAPASTTKS